MPKAARRLDTYQKILSKILSGARGHLNGRHLGAMFLNFKITEPVFLVVLRTGTRLSWSLCLQKTPSAAQKSFVFRLVRRRGFSVCEGSRGIHSTSRTRVRLVVVVVVVVIVVVVEPRGTFPTRRLGDGPTRRSQDPENSAASSRTGWARVHPAAATTRSTRRNGCSTGCISLSS